MKIKRKFTPVVIKLESQEEVDELFSLIARQDLADVVPSLSSNFEALIPYATTDYKVAKERFCSKFTYKDPALRAELERAKEEVSVNN